MVQAMAIKLAAKRVFTFGVENPISGDDIPRFRVPRSFTVERITALAIQGTGQLDFELRFDPFADQQGFGTLIQAGAGIGSIAADRQAGRLFTVADFGVVVIQTDDWVWLELSNVSTGLARPVAMSVVMTGVEKGG